MSFIIKFILSFSIHSVNWKRHPVFNPTQYKTYEQRSLNSFNSFRSEKWLKRNYFQLLYYETKKRWHVGSSQACNYCLFSVKTFELSPIPDIILPDHIMDRRKFGNFGREETVVTSLKWAYTLLQNATEEHPKILKKPWTRQKKNHLKKCVE